MPGEGQVMGRHSCNMSLVNDEGRHEVFWKLRGGAQCSPGERRDPEGSGKEHFK